ncbi:hypothetical protein [Enterobacter phage N5822]|nr:hypothetical protein [Enterobacter phage N5822]
MRINNLGAFRVTDPLIMFLKQRKTIDRPPFRAISCAQQKTRGETNG